MPRSQKGLQAAGEWEQLSALLPEWKDKSILDLGCGYGWHCRYAYEQGAATILGIDVSEKMLQEARKRNNGQNIQYRLCSIEQYEYPQETWDVVLSNLALHYIEDLTSIFQNVYDTLKTGGTFLFNIEHPIFTSGVNQDWLYDQQGNPMCWPIDDYFMDGVRKTSFLGCEVEKQHHTLTQILMGVLRCGFVLEVVEEARPSAKMLKVAGMKEELRRPMMLLVKAKKQ